MPDSDIGSLESAVDSAQSKRTEQELFEHSKVIWTLKVLNKEELFGFWKLIILEREIDSRVKYRLMHFNQLIISILCTDIFTDL